MVFNDIDGIKRKHNYNDLNSGIFLIRGRGGIMQEITELEKVGIVMFQAILTMFKGYCPVLIQKQRRTQKNEEISPESENECSECTK